jgi:hypothetical protein
MREFIIDVVLLIGIVLLLPLAIPLVLLAFAFMLLKRSNLWPHRARA